MNAREKEELVALDDEMEAKGEALGEKLASHTNPSQLRDDTAALNELLQGRALIKALLANLDGERALIGRRSSSIP